MFDSRAFDTRSNKNVFGTNASNGFYLWNKMSITISKHRDRLFEDPKQSRNTARLIMADTEKENRKRFIKNRMKVNNEAVEEEEEKAQRKLKNSSVEEHYFLTEKYIS